MRLILKLSRQVRRQDLRQTLQGRSKSSKETPWWIFNFFKVSSNCQDLRTLELQASRLKCIKENSFNLGLSCSSPQLALFKLCQGNQAKAQVTPIPNSRQSPSQAKIQITPRSKSRQGANHAKTQVKSTLKIKSS